MPLIIPSNSISGEFEVANSLRFNRSSSDSLTRTPVSDGDRQKWTISLWIKKSNLSVQQLVFSCGTYSEINLKDDGQLYIQVSNNNSTAHAIRTDRVLRDVSAWYHIVVACDTTQGTASNRLRLYINGSEETSFSPLDQRSAITQNMSTAICGQFEHRFGIDENTSNYYGGYLAEAVLIDGQALDQTSFGEFDSATGIWKPIDVSGLTFGTNGFYLDFENSGSLGADVSGNGNNFTVNNLTSIDQSTDTCTNNFATYNPLVIDELASMSEGNLQGSVSSTGEKKGVATIGVSSGKWYAEQKVSALSGTLVNWFGIFEINDYAINSSGRSLSNGQYNWGYENNGSVDNNGSDVGSGLPTYTTGDIIGIALDLDNGYIYFSKNGTFINSGDPTSGATGTGGFSVNITDKTYCMGAVPYAFDGTTTIQANFGNPPFTISSGNSDGNGYGNFEYSVPSGYYALNTKNLAEYG